MAGRVVEDSSLYETWKSNIAGTIVLKKIDRKGDLEDEIIPGHKVFNVTPTERRLYQERVADDSLDVFQNGMCVPVRLIETAEDVEAIRNNPNHMTESDMAGLFKLKTVAAFTEKVSTITNPITLNRLLEIATSDETDASHKQVQIVQAAAEAAAPAPMFNEVQTISGPRGPITR